MQSTAAPPLATAITGLVADGKRVFDGAMTSGLNVLTSASAAFVASDFGKSVTVAGGTSPTANLLAWIGSVTSATQVTLVTTRGGNTPANAGATVSGATTVWGTDNTAAINTALGTAGSFYLPPNAMTCHVGVLNLPTAGTVLLGTGATLMALDPYNCALHITASSATVQTIVRDVYHTVARGPVPRLSANFSQSPFNLDGATNVLLDGCVSEFSPASGMFFSTQTATPTSLFRVVNCVVRRSLADGYHNTTGTHSGVFIAPVAEYAGDDMFACVAYVNDTTAVHNIRWISPKGRGQNGSGRGLSFVGCYDCSADDVDIHDSWQAAIYFASEQGAFNTQVPHDCYVYGGRLTRANYNGPDQGGIVFYAGVGTAQGLTGAQTAMRNCWVYDLIAQDARYIKAGNNSAGATGGTGGGYFVNIGAKVVLTGSVAGFAAATGTSVDNNGAQDGSTGVDFRQVTLGGMWGTGATVAAVSARRVLVNDQALASGSVTQINIGGNSFKTDSAMYAPASGLQITVTGIYLVTTSLMGRSEAPGAILDAIAQYTRGGTTYPIGESNAETSVAGDLRTTAVFPINLVAGDVVTLSVYTNVAVTIGGGGVPPNTYLTASLVGTGTG